MDDARGNRLPIAARGRGRAGLPLGHRLAAGAWVALPLFAWPGRLRAATGWRPEYGWILGAGVACLGAAWLLSRVGAWHELARRGLEPGHTPPAARGAGTARPRVRWEDRLASSATGRAGSPVTAPAIPSGSGSSTVRGEEATPGARRASRRIERLGFGAPRRPSATTAWLHLVSGATPALTARAACTVAADLIDRGGRVLLVDAGRRCVLHARFGRESRWGVGECLARTLPVLGVVQPTGFTGLHLLARGAEPRLSWESLGRLADDAHAHYDHVLMALDPDTPREAGMAIVGRLVEGWWAGERISDRAVMGLSERLGIVFASMPMGLESEVSLEPGMEPVAAVVPSGSASRAAPVRAAAGWAGMDLPAVVAFERPAFAPALAVADDWNETVAAILAGPSFGSGHEPEHEHETLVLACDDDVRARLKFLMWVRGMAGSTPAASPAWKLAGARA